MQLFQEVKKQLEQESKKFSKSFHSIRFSQDFLSLSGFKDIYQGLIIFGSYGLAASILPFILNMMSTPIALLSFGVGIFATMLGLYHYIREPNKNFKLSTDLEIQGHHIALAGAVLMGIAPLMTILSIIAPALLLATGIFRAYASIPEKTRNNISDLFSQIIRPS